MNCVIFKRQLPDPQVSETYKLKVFFLIDNKSCKSTWLYDEEKKSDYFRIGKESVLILKLKRDTYEIRLNIYT